MITRVTLLLRCSGRSSSRGAEHGFSTDTRCCCASPRDLTWNLFYLWRHLACGDSFAFYHAHKFPAFWSFVLRCLFYLRLPILSSLMLSVPDPLLCSFPISCSMIRSRDPFFEDKSLNIGNISRPIRSSKQKTNRSFLLHCIEMFLRAQLKLFCLRVEIGLVALERPFSQARYFGTVRDWGRNSGKWQITFTQRNDVHRVPRRRRSGS